MEARVSRNLTLKEVADRVDTDVANLSRIERGQMPKRDLARRLVQFFHPDVPFAAFFEDEPPCVTAAGEEAN